MRFLVEVFCLFLMYNTKHRLEIEGSHIEEGWELDRVELRNVDQPEEKYVFPCGELLSRDTTMFKVLYPQAD